MSNSHLLLSRSKRLLSQLLRLHIVSVDIGRLEQVADAGVVTEECRQAAAILEDGDLLCAEIDAHLVGNGKTEHREWIDRITRTSEEDIRQMELPSKEK